MRKLALCILLLLSPTVFAAQPCAHSQPRNLQLDLAGVDTVVFDIGGNDIDINGSNGATNRIDGRACASNEKYLAGLTLTQRKDGNTLLVTAKFESQMSFFLGHAYMKLEASIPDTLMVQLKVGSGDATLDGARNAQADVGSGDIKVTNVKEQLTASVGSGDLVVDDIGSLHLLFVGSGDATIKRVRGSTEIGSIGSGDMGISHVDGVVTIGSIGSGDANLDSIGGDVTLGSLGSGDLAVADVRGNLTVRSTGSGDVNHRNVSGTVDVPRRR